MSRYARAFSAEAESNKPQGSFLKKALADAVSAYTAGAMCTPFIATLDRAVTENASGRNTIYGSATSSFREILKSPLTFLKAPAFRWVLFVYGTTYCTNNLFDTYSSHFRRDVAMEKWLGASAINSTASMLKDRAFAALFGATAVPGTVPLGSYLAWGSRDLMSMAFFVSLPPLVGHELAKHTGNERLSYYAAQFMMPLLLQFVTSPIHLLGFDFYNNRNASVRARVGSMFKDYRNNVATRMLRMMVPWSIGSIGNKELRTALHGVVEPATLLVKPAAVAPAAAPAAAVAAAPVAVPAASPAPAAETTVAAAAAETK